LERALQGYGMSLDRLHRSSSIGMEPMAQTLEVRARSLEREQRFFAFVEAHQDRAVRIAWRLLGGDHHAAEDVAQQAFFKAYRGLAQFRENSTLATWFYRILINEARSHRRWRALRDRWHAVWIAEAIPDRAANPDPTLRRRLADALDRLSPGQREVFVLVYLEGFTLERTAAQLDKALGTVKSQLHRALRVLRAELADLHRSPHGTGGTQ
jgi:RNA polymerase sigma-70 factor, ECF subfamily